MEYGEDELEETYNLIQAFLKALDKEKQIRYLTTEELLLEEQILSFFTTMRVLDRFVLTY